MKQVTVTITTDKPVNVKITPCKDLLECSLGKFDSKNTFPDNGIA